MLGLWLLSFFTTLALGAKPAIPADGQLELGAWLDISNYTQDSPVKANARCGFNFSSFQFAQKIPNPPYNFTTGAGGPANFTFIELTGTNASVFLTVYPTTLGNVSNNDWQILGNQILTYQSPPYNRAVFLRYGPEMNGNWFEYGMQPAQFVQHWQQMHSVVSGIAPDTAFVWAPNNGVGYPFSYSLSNPMATSTPADAQALGNFQNAYTPYYPGDEYVDWVGISLYWKGSEYPFTVNELVSPTEYTGAMSSYDWYTTYCNRKPCMLSESGAAFHVNTTNGPGVGQLAIQNSWLDLFFGQNPTYTAYPKLKMIQMFEHEKVEDFYDLRDFTVTNATDTLAAFRSRVSPLIASGTILQAGPAPIVSIVPSASASALLAGSTLSGPTATLLPSSAAPSGAALAVVDPISGSPRMIMDISRWTLGAMLLGVLYVCLRV